MKQQDLVKQQQIFNNSNQAGRKKRDTEKQREEEQETEIRRKEEVKPRQQKKTLSIFFLVTCIVLKSLNKACNLSFLIPFPSPPPGLCCISVRVQPYSTTLFGVPFPLPTPQGRWDRQLRDKPETEIRGLR